MKISASVVGLLIGIAAAPVALGLAVASGGAGHGHYFAAKLLFPYTMASAYFLDSITPPFIVLAVLQFPAYGWLIGWSIVRKRVGTTVPIIVAVHAAVAAVVYWYPPRFFA